MEQEENEQNYKKATRRSWTRNQMGNPDSMGIANKVKENQRPHLENYEPALFSHRSPRKWV
jgi:hypothetical protein